MLSIRLRNFLTQFTQGWMSFLCCGMLLWGCASTPDPTDPLSQGDDGIDEQIFVGDSIEMSYDPNVIMKRAESFFDKESYAEAIVEYKHFLDLHRNHMLAPYAQFKIGSSHHKQYRTVDRDPSPLNKAIAEFDKLLKEYPGSRYEAQAKKTTAECKELLVQRHLMVGEFYLKRESYLAAAHRFEKIILEYPELDTAGDAMFHLAQTYQDLGLNEWTQKWLLALVNQHPDNQYYASAKQQLDDLHEEYPTLLASLPPTAQNPVSLLPNSSPDQLPLPESPTPDFAHAGLLPQDQTSLQPPAQPSPSKARTTSCAVGQWCDSPTTIPVSIAPPTPPNSQSCKPGEWC